MLNKGAGQSCALLIAIIFSIDFALVQGAFGQARQLQPREFHENKMKETPISGEQLVGLMALPPRSMSPAWNSVYVHLNPSLHGRIDVRVVDVEGKYQAEMAYLTQSVADGWWKLNVPTRYPDSWKKKRPQELAILASLTEGKGPSILLPVAFDPFARPLHIIALVNRGGATDAYISAPDKRSRAECTDLAAEIMTAYNLQCDLTGILASPINKVSMIRMDFETVLRPLDFVISRP